MIHELVRVDTILDGKLIPESSVIATVQFIHFIGNFIFAWCHDGCACVYRTVGGGDAGWGLESSDAANVHFSTSIAKSYLLLEKTALSRRPGMKHVYTRTVREYVLNLRKVFPNLRDGLIQEYINTYERAVFGEHKYTLEEFNRFQSVVEAMVAIINEKGTVGAFIAPPMTGSAGGREVPVSSAKTALPLDSPLSSDTLALPELLPVSRPTSIRRTASMREVEMMPVLPRAESGYGQMEEQKQDS